MNIWRTINGTPLKFDTPPQIQFDLGFLLKLKRNSLSRHHWSIDLQRPSYWYATGTDYKSFVWSWFMNSIAPQPITMEILSEIGWTKIIVRRASLAKSALIRAVVCSFLFLIHPNNLRGNGGEISQRTIKRERKKKRKQLCHFPTSSEYSFLSIPRRPTISNVDNGESYLRASLWPTDRNIRLENDRRYRTHNNERKTSGTG